MILKRLVYHITVMTDNWRVPRSKGEDSTDGRIVEAYPDVFMLQFSSGGQIMTKSVSKAAFWWSNRENPRIQAEIHFFALEDGRQFCNVLHGFYSISMRLSAVGRRWSCYNPETKETQYMHIAEVCTLVNSGKLPLAAIENALDVRVAPNDEFGEDDIPNAKTVREWLEETIRL